MNDRTEIAVFGGGCFWCTEAVFEQLDGVISVLPGYAGGTLKNPTYRQVCTGKTGHAEVVRVEYDPTRVPYRNLLTVFFATHDPTSLNRQGADVGTEYRSAVFYATEDQKQQAYAYIEELNGSDPRGNPIVTEVSPLEVFYPAEDYHREYFSNNSELPYCQFVIVPKLAKLHKNFRDLLKSARPDASSKTPTID
ncbi:MAG: peptide-methionine (S)-S-oxide reductase MsrA [Candidatus Binataceae bacterium]|jgi:peptide-methionine (S)-S-oxide reductase